VFLINTNLYFGFVIHPVCTHTQPDKFTLSNPALHHHSIVRHQAIYFHFLLYHLSFIYYFILLHKPISIVIFLCASQ